MAAAQVDMEQELQRVAAHLGVQASGIIQAAALSNQLSLKQKGKRANISTPAATLNRKSKRKRRLGKRAKYDEFGSCEEFTDSEKDDQILSFHCSESASGCHDFFPTKSELEKHMSATGHYSVHDK